MPRPHSRARTQTRTFGSGSRNGHDASAFYSRFAAPELSDDTTINPAPDTAVDHLFAGDSRRMAELPDNSVALAVTSPPYFAGKAYEADLGADGVPASYAEYLDMLHDVLAETVRVLEPGGRVAVNVANLGRRPFRSLAADVTGILQDDLGLLLRGEVVWVKQAGAAGSAAWGTFNDPRNPVMRDTTERIIVASKGMFHRLHKATERATLGLPHQVDGSADEFMAATLDVWHIAPESATRVGHPAPFPVAIPERLIRLHTYRGDLVLDPFVGSGSTAVAAARTGRHYVGYDLDPDHIRTAADRVAHEGQPTPTPETDMFTKSAVAAFTAAGFTNVELRTPLIATGVRADLTATKRGGQRVAGFLIGNRSMTAPGLRTVEVIWAVAGRAQAATDAGWFPIIVTPGNPARRGDVAAAYTAALEAPGVPVVHLDTDEAAAKLAQLATT